MHSCISPFHLITDHLLRFVTGSLQNAGFSARSRIVYAPCFTHQGLLWQLLAAQTSFMHFWWKGKPSTTESARRRTDSSFLPYLRLVNKESDERGYQHGARHGRAFPARLRFAEGENGGRWLLGHRHRVRLTQAGHDDHKPDRKHQLNLFYTRSTPQVSDAVAA